MFTVWRLWNYPTRVFLGEGDMAILLRFGLMMLSLGYHLYFEGNRIPEFTVF